MSGPACVVSLTVTRRRAPLLKRLLDSLEQVGPALHEIVVVSDGPDPDSESVARGCARPVRYRVLTGATGVGPGMKFGVQAALENREMTHCLLLDDDALVPPGALSILLEEMERNAAGCAVPLIEDQQGFIGWFPGALGRPQWQVLRRPKLTREEFLAACGDKSVSFTWAPWGFLLVSRAVIEAIGLPRDDFGLGGHDLEWTLRASAHAPAVLVPRARGWHWPPPRGREPAAYDKECLELQNLCFIVSRLPHGRRAARHLPGAFWRLLRKWGFKPATIADAFRAAWHGLVRQRPALADGGGVFWRRYLQHRHA